jgi:hypothetical protein
MATKVCSAKPNGKVRRMTVRPTLDERIKEIRKQLGLNHKWESLKLQLKMQQT